jgi:nucleoside-diphosphate-sugar epimerase
MLVIAGGLGFIGSRIAVQALCERSQAVTFDAATPENSTDGRWPSS